MSNKSIFLRGLSLFSNIGVAEACLEDIGVNILLANEIDPDRSKFYEHVYPKTEVITGDIKRESVYSRIIKKSKEFKIDFVIATPPCQGMSTAGKLDPLDKRNQLIYYALKIIKNIKPKYAILENIPQQLKTYISVNNQKLKIPEYIKLELSNQYIVNESIVNATDYGVPQIRRRSIFLLTKKNIENKLNFIEESEKVAPINLIDSIGHLPSLDPQIQGFTTKEQLSYFPDYIKKMEKGLMISKWHRPPVHKIRHVEVMKYVPEGESALNNKIYYPKNKDGSRIRGYPNTYKRQWWNRPAYTVTTYNGAICSHDNVHPGRKIGHDQKGNAIFSDARVLSIYELMIVMSLPLNWNIPEWANDSLIRHGIGEGIPPLIIQKILQKLIDKF
ncbi:DNA cytosine methyltransferase [Candidatus Omnitrophota bacterium]